MTLPAPGEVVRLNQLRLLLLLLTLMLKGSQI